MSEKKENTGGVLVIPMDKNHPASFSYVSPRERYIIRNPRTGRKTTKPVVYTFRRGKPARVENEEDYQNLLKETVYLSDGRGFAPMFEKVIATGDPGTSAVQQQVTALFHKFLADNNINLETLIQSASGDDSTVPPEAPDALDNPSV